MDVTEWVAWAGWGLTVALWAWRSRPRPSLPAAAAAGRHRLDTWTAVLDTGTGVVCRHGRGPMPPTITYRGVRYTAGAADRADASVRYYHTN